MNSDKMTLLIVDDKQANIFAVEKLLEKSERIFLTATNAKDGLKIALKEEIDLIILDVQMPEMDGFEMAKILKSNNRTKDIPILFASAEKKERQFIMKGFEEGAVDYLSKPLDPELTKAKVSVLLTVQHQRKEIRDLNSELKRNLIQLEAANKELGSFSYSVSHDLRAPLRSLMGYSRMLEEDYGDKLDDEGKKMLDVIEKNALKMNSLIDNLLEFSRSGQQVVKKSGINMSELVQSVIGEINNVSGGNTKFKIHQLISLQADYALLKQVWINLISNAIKYSSKSKSPLVEIGSRKDENEAIFYVKDNGVGFDMQYSEKLFGVFQRLHKAEEFEGTGVGLSIVKRVIAKHGGRVWAEGKEHTGAIFYFSLPVENEGSTIILDRQPHLKIKQ